MAVVGSNLTSGGATGTPSSAATASITPTANNLILLTVVSRTNASVQPNAPTATGNGLTWVQVNTIYYDTDSTSRKTITLLRAMGASPTTGAITIDFASQAQTDIVWAVDQFSGVDTSGTNGSGAVVQSATAKDETAASATLTVTLAAFSNTNNGAFGCLTGDNSGTLPTAGSGFTALVNTNSLPVAGSLQAFITEWRNDNDTTVDAVFGNAAGNKKGGIAIEIAASPLQFDAASNSTYQAASSSYNWLHTCTGTSRYLVVGVSMLSLAQTVSGITYNSVAMTFLGAQNSVSGAARVELWGLIAPATGSNSIAVTLTGAIASAACAVSFVGVNQTSPTEGFNSAQATNVGAADATVNVTTVAVNDVVVDQVATDDTAITVGALQTQRNNVTGAGGSGADSTELATAAAAYTMSWTNVGALATWSIAAIALRDTNASGGATPSALGTARALMGVGI